MWLQIVLAAALAASLTPSRPSSFEAKDEVHEGKVISVGSDTITVMDKSDDDLDKFVVTSTTTITRNGKPAKLSDVQVGDRAKVTAVQEGAKLVAKSIVAAAPE